MKLINTTLTIAFVLCFFASSSQIKVLSSGNTQIGGSSAHTGATLNLYSYNGTTIRSDVYHTGGWGDVPLIIIKF